MTSLPISLPTGYSAVVKKGDGVTSGQVLATSTVEKEKATSSPAVTSESVIDLSVALGSKPSALRKFLKKSPGDSVSVNDVIAEKPGAFGLKKQRVVSNVIGTIASFERDTGKLYVQSADALPTAPLAPEKKEILSPLAGKITVCNNDEIVIEIEGKALVGGIGSGPCVSADVLVLTPVEDKKAIVSAQITPEVINKIVLLPDIDTEALVKADAIGVLGVLGTGFSKQLIEYIETRKLGLAVIGIDPAIGKKILKVKGPITIHGDQKTILLEE
jgi:hypothetical protein